MNIQTVLVQFLERGMALQTFWGFYISVAAALIAFFGSSHRSKRMAVLASVIFVAFAWVNLAGMTEIWLQRKFLWGVLHTASANGFLTGALDKSIIPAMTDPSEPYPLTALRSFHAGADLLVFGAIWILTIWPPQTKKDGVPAKDAST